eukprot:1160801-Pelagomonas_calceolata.AAC.1
MKSSNELQMKSMPFSFVLAILCSLRRTFAHLFSDFKSKRSPLLAELLLDKSGAFHYTQASSEISFISCRSKLIALRPNM